MLPPRVFLAVGLPSSNMGMLIKLAFFWSVRQIYIQVFFSFFVWWAWPAFFSALGMHARSWLKLLLLLLLLWLLLQLLLGDL